MKKYSMIILVAVLVAMGAQAKADGGALMVPAQDGQTPAILSVMCADGYQVIDDEALDQVVGEDLFLGLKLRVFGKSFNWKWRIWKTDIIDNTINLDIGLNASID